jgi:hypothetical protein
MLDICVFLCVDLPIIAYSCQSETRKGALEDDHCVFRIFVRQSIDLTIKDEKIIKRSA